jgi:hypothetical protein
LYYLQSRYYDPAIGRFISADGLLGETGNLVTHNMYAYCGNNPVMMIDPDGKFPIWLTIIGAVLGGIVGGITALQNGAELGSQQYWIGVGTGSIIGGAVGAVAGFSFTGGSSLFIKGGLSSVGNKLISDSASSILYGTINFGSWEDYAVAFVIGGIIKGRDYSGVSKWFLDSVARPGLNQLTKMGTRGAELSPENFAFDVFARTVTFKTGNDKGFFGLELNPTKAILRGFFSGMGKIIYDR